MAALESTSIIGVIGAGTMGAGIAQVAASAGHSVRLYDVTENAAKTGIKNIAEGLQKLVDKGRLSQRELESITGNIEVADSLETLANCGMIIEAVVEKLQIKQRLFTELESLCSDNVILASNTSSLSLTAIGAPLKRPQNLVGVHFFNPAPVMKLVEIISSLATDTTVAETAFDTVQAWGKKPVHARSTPGFIVNRVARPFYAEALRLYEEGAASYATIDAIVKGSGNFRMGPFELMDLIGHDVNYAVTCSVFDAFHGDPRFKPSQTQKELVDAGFLGKKSGRGFYNYTIKSENCGALIEPLKPKPESIELHGDSHWITQCANFLKKLDLPFSHQDGSDDFIRSDSACIRLSNGTSATLFASERKLTNLIFVDLFLNLEDATHIALSPADQTTAQSQEDACRFFQALGKSVSILDDIPGLCVLRTLCMLANEGADAVNQRVCTASAVDTAMKNGVNYPVGPMEWASAFGLPSVVEILDNLYLYYGEDRYRVSPWLRRKAASGLSLYE